MAYMLCTQISHNIKSNWWFEADVGQHGHSVWSPATHLSIIAFIKYFQCLSLSTTTLKPPGAFKNYQVILMWQLISVFHFKLRSTQLRLLYVLVQQNFLKEVIWEQTKVQSNPYKQISSRFQLTMAELLDLGLALSHPCLNAPLGLIAHQCHCINTLMLLPKATRSPLDCMHSRCHATSSASPLLCSLDP